jgi:hypothetical protein
VKQLRNTATALFLIALYVVSLGFTVGKDNRSYFEEEATIKKQEVTVTNFSNEAIDSQSEVVKSIGQNSIINKTAFNAKGFLFLARHSKETELSKYNQYLAVWNNQQVLLRHCDQLFPQHHFW